MSRIIVDVTQLAHWTGKITGIPRVMDELAKRFASSKEYETAFAVWVKELQDFCEIDFEQTIIERRGIVYKRPTGVGDSDPQEASKQSVSLSSAKPLVKRAAKKALSVASRFSPEISHKLESRAKQIHMQGYKRVDFRKDDIFFIPWGEWWDSNFTDRLVRTHTEQGVRLVQVIHDVATTVWPQFFEQVEVNPESYNAKIVPIADLVLCVSQNTKRELTEWLESKKLHIPKMEVFRLGDVINVTKSVKPSEEAFVKSKLKGKDYIMCVGTIEAKKNHAMFYYVYKRAAELGIDLPKIVIVGRRGWGTNDIYRIMTNDPQVKGKFVFLHDASDENLSWLYDHCLFTVLPSFHEGWGIPIAESLGRGVPNISSNTSSMVEIAEGISEHFSPTSTDECLAAIQRMLQPKYYQAALGRVKKYKPTTWDDSFHQVDAHLKRLK